MTTPRAANPTRLMLATWELTSAVTASMIDWSVCTFLSTGRTLVPTNFAV
jgi:hypothetical protein